MQKFKVPKVLKVKVFYKF